jgi:hypothetical protein
MARGRSFSLAMAPRASALASVAAYISGRLKAGSFDTGLHHVGVFGHQDQVEFRGLGHLLGHGGKGIGISADIFDGHQLRPQVQPHPLELQGIPAFELGFQVGRSHIAADLGCQQGGVKKVFS